MGKIMVEGLGIVEIAGDAPTAEEAAAIARALQPAAPPPVASTPMPTLPANGPLRSLFDDPALGQTFREAGTRAVAGAQPGTPVVDVPASLAFASAFARRFGDNILAVPELLIDTIVPRLLPVADERFTPGPLELVSKGISAVTGGAVDPIAASERVRERVRQGGHVIDLPSTGDIAAGIEVAADDLPDVLERMRQAFVGANGVPFVRPPATLDPGQRLTAPPPTMAERFRQAQTEQMITDIQMAEGAPVATGAGEIAGDIATLIGGRAALRGGVPLQQAAPVVAARAQSILGRALQTTGRALVKAGTRAAETGGEAAFLAALQGADPMEVGAIAAGVQLGSDPLRAAVLQLRKPSVLGSALLMATSASLAVQQWTPGGLDRVLPTLEGKNKELWGAMLLAGPAMFLGRMPANFAPGKAFGPAFAEVVNLLPRGAMNSLLTSYIKDGARVGPVLAKFSEDPDYFGPKARRLLERAITQEDIDLSRTLDRLMEERDFRRRVNALSSSGS